MLFFDHASRRRQTPRSFNISFLDSSLRAIMDYLARSLEERLQTDLPAVWKQPFQPDVIEALSVLAYGKCPFCEQRSVALQPYRFRPPAYAEPSATPDEKPCYLWLSLNWNNFFPICSDCLPAQKALFPVEGRRAHAPTALEPEQLLYEPGLIDREAAVLFYPGEPALLESGIEIAKDGNLVASDVRGAATISHFALNRHPLVVRRRQAIESQIEALRNGSAVGGGAPLEQAEFGGSRYLVLRQLAQFLSERYDEAPSLDPQNIQGLFDIWIAERPDFPIALASAIRRLSPKGATKAKEAVRSRTFPHPRPRVDFPRLGSVRIKNFKSLESIGIALPERARIRASLMPAEATEEPGAPCLLILGENAAGKSSLLEAIALACLAPATRSRLKLNPGMLVLKPQYMGAPAGYQGPRASEIVLAFHGGSELGVTINENGITTTGKELPLVFAYGAHRLFGGKERRGAIRHVDTLFGYDRHISNPAAWLINLAKSQPQALNEVVSALRHIIQIDGEFQNIEVGPDEHDGSERCYINIRKQRPNGTSYIVRQQLEVASSGYRAILALVCDVFQGLMAAVGASRRPASARAQGSDAREARSARHSNAIVLIDEVEAHLHPRWKLNIITGLRRALPRVTFILTSHDPLCVRGMLNGEVMMLNRFQILSEPGQDQLPEAVEQVHDFGNIEEMTVEQLLTSNLFQLFSTDDQRTDETFSAISRTLARQRNGEPLNTEEQVALEKFNREIAQALPYGRTEITQVIQEAVAEYLEQRRKRDQKATGMARDRAKAAVRDFLQSLLQ
ncbi:MULTISPECIES: AAA family ATPase [unclassified Mesorhizobium]|uniref:AAA family ATPase n=1 Tax=unclassified Mesorhizobium TaxID=325217 RepID=UPI0015E44281|nr:MULTISPECIES: AAA family ATPase [unclassified Mesorhizobium]